MIDLDTWQEIFETISKNKLRTLLTGFSVAWGIFMLVILLGSGNGMAHGIEYQFRDDAINSIWVTAGQTSTPYRGLAPGRSIQFTNRDFDEVKDRVHGVEHATARFAIQGGTVVRYGNETGSFQIRSVHPEHRFVENTIIIKGRYLNAVDIRERRKVAVVGKLVVEALFVDGGDPLGREIEINGIAFKVVGVFDDIGNEQEQEMVHLPISTAQRTFNGQDRIRQVLFTVGDATLEESQVIAADVRQRMATRHQFDPEDLRAVFVNNNIENFQRFVGMMNGIRGFVWVVGIGTLLAGVVGVSNIMLIAVKERTREIGIRKAIGATPGSILRLVLLESVLVTSVAGYLGLLLGIVLLEGVTRAMPAADFFRNPEVDLKVAVSATVLLVVAGAIAGFFPARQAASIRPIEALRDE